MFDELNKINEEREKEAQLEQQLEELFVRMFFTPCSSKAELKQWIITYLGIDLPDHTVDENSSSNPMNFIWDIYDSIKTGNIHKSSFVAAASRNGFKTLSTSILEFLAMVHFSKDVVHLSAILDQSLAAIGYLDQFLGIAILKPYLAKNAQRTKRLKDLPRNQYRGKPNCKLSVIVASKESANGQRGNLLVFDEVDLLDPAVLSESAMIGDPDRLKRPPAYVYISSRKSASGPIQKKIDDSRKNGSHIQLHLWSISDMMQVCPPDVHRPDLPIISRFINKESLEIKDPEDMFLVTKLDAYEEIKCYSGCRTCPAFVVCRGRAPKQKGTSIGLRDLGTVTSIVRETSDPEQIKAQLLNLKPESSGQIFNRFTREKHYRPMYEVYEFVFGIKPKTVPTKENLIKEMREAGGWRFTCGVDFGYVDPAAAVLVAYHRGFDKVVILHAEMSPGYSNTDWLALVKAKIYLRYGFDLLCPDTADKSAPAVSARLGMPSRNKKPLRIETGISWIRNHLWSASKQDSSLVILQDDSTECVAQAFEGYQYRKGPNGFLFDQFDTDGYPSHLCDSCRYSIDIYCMDNSLSLGIEQPDQRANKHKSPDGYYQHSPEGFRAIMEEHYADEYNIDLRQNKEDTTYTDANGNFAFSF